MYKRDEHKQWLSVREMDAFVPLAIGTRGTVGSLVKKEIEYFAKLELERHGGSERISGEGSKKTRFWVVSLTWKWKKRRTNNGFAYRILKHDLNHFPI